MSTKFQRRTEDFRCDHCGHEVHGNGYTNHCPHCLWSKHVDRQPGDRAAECRGLMPPVNVELLHDEFVITHECQTCGERRRNRAAPEDDRDELVRIAKLHADREWAKRR